MWIIKIANYLSDNSEYGINVDNTRKTERTIFTYLS